jgi:hypothetical protein
VAGEFATSRQESIEWAIEFRTRSSAPRVGREVDWVCGVDRSATKSQSAAGDSIERAKSAMMLTGR